ncbi:anaerobic ribonucleoside-triphosphate reductase activating protein [Paenibacillus polymyxa]|uniref:Anaerobic ribonucleoside-triphosphate reductase-activating protein n=1 Tax=Paenibacillus polymyxa (strain SC2) TaxID=886882 RepID=A0A0D5ZCU1_PAEPS|nr:anaerobic ribonucleoside-triphosphate reductase activating protein [Paenibacillus polymyxa]AKA44389.1 ribonucleoside-triphosphate reductase activating protein [Paenibacillus polymyxa SC2]WPQ59763.1 anaerobic ribonucleoside-triphosphate reductase activating protein [Paenibacillus polymyxa]
MRVINIIKDSVVDGPGLRTTIFFAGCPHHCLGCHNPKSWSVCAGIEMSTNEVAEHVLQNPINHVTFSGGEPFSQNEKELIYLAKELKNKGRNIWCYTGYVFEDVVNKEVLKYIDVLVDGKFELEKRNLSLNYKGSENQRIIDVQKSLQSGDLVLYELE